MKSITIALFLCLFVSVSCTKKEDSTNPSYSVNALEVGEDAIDENTTLNFGTGLEENVALNSVVKITKGTASSGLFQRFEIQNQSPEGVFTLASVTCAGYPQTNKNCYARVIFKVSPLAFGENEVVEATAKLVALNQNQEIMFSINLFGSATKETSSEGVELEILNETVSLGVSPEEMDPLNFDLASKTSDQKVLVVKNPTDKNIKVLTSSTNNGRFKVVLNKCLNVVLKPGKNCQIKVYADLSWGEEVQDSLIINVEHRPQPLFLSLIASVPPAKLSLDLIKRLDGSIVGGAGEVFLGNQNFNAYDTSTWKNIVTLTYDNISTFKILDLRRGLPTCVSDCVTNLEKWMTNGVTELKLPNYTVNGSTMPVVIVSDATGKYAKNPVKITGSSQGENFIVDLFSSGSYMNFNGGGSGYNLNPSPNPKTAPEGFGFDLLEFRRPVLGQISTPINLSNKKETIEMKTSTGEIIGRFSNIDRLNLGRYSSTYMNSGNPNHLLNSFDYPKIFNLTLSNNNMPNKRQWVVVNQKNQLNASFENTTYTTHYQNPILNSIYGEFQGAYAIVVRYFTSSLMKPALAFDATYGNPEVNFTLKTAKSSCGAPGATSSELEVLRGKPGKEQITDHLCGTRALELVVENGETLLSTVSASSSTPMKALGLVHLGGNNGGSSSRVYLHVPSSSQVIPDNANYIFLGGGSMCGNRIVNHKFEGYIKTSSCIGNRNIVAVGANAEDAPLRKYDGVKRIKIFDTLSNKANWRLHCSWDGKDVAVKVRNTVTNKEMRFYHVARFDNDDNPQYRYGHCGGLIRWSYNNNYQNLPPTDYTNCSIDEAINNPNACVQDGLGSNGFFEVEFVDTSSSSETLESFVGR